MDSSKSVELICLLCGLPFLLLLLVGGTFISGLKEDCPKKIAGFRTVDNAWVSKKLHELQEQCDDVLALKVLQWDSVDQVWRSPRYGTPWVNGQIMADHEPSKNKDNGIYTCWNYDQLESYLVEDDSNYLFVVGLIEPVDQYDAGYRSGGAYIVKKLA